MAISQITDHAAQSLATMSQWARGKARLAKLNEILADEVQLLEDVLWEVYENSILENATGVILDEYGKIFDEPRAGLADKYYYQVLQVIIGAHQSEGGAARIAELFGILVSTAVRYTVKFPASYRLTYTASSHSSGDWRARILRIAEILRPVGVSHAVIEADSTSPFTFDSGPGFDNGKLADRIV